MTVEQLLEKRIELIAGWPGCKWPIGTLFPENFIGKLEVEKYPHLFRPLQWWQERHEKDMPDYVRYKFLSDSEDQILHIVKHFTTSWGTYNWLGFLSDDGEYRSYSKTMPATEQDYNDYLTNKTIDKLK